MRGINRVQVIRMIISEPKDFESLIISTLLPGSCPHEPEGSLLWAATAEEGKSSRPGIKLLYYGLSEMLV